MPHATRVWGEALGALVDGFGARQLEVGDPSRPSEIALGLTVGALRRRHERSVRRPAQPKVDEWQARVKPNVSPKTLESSVVRSTTPDDGEVPAPWPTAMASCCAVL